MKLTKIFFIVVLLAATFQLHAQCYVEGETCVQPSLIYNYDPGEFPDYDPYHPEYDIPGFIFLSWSVTNGTMLSPSDAAPCVVSWNNVCETGVVTLNALVQYEHYIDSTGTYLITYELFTCNLDVHFIHSVDAPVVEPTGGNNYSVVECGDISPLFFQANSGCATNYVWQAINPFPPGGVNTTWNIQPIGSGATAIVTPDGVTPAIIQVYGQNCVGTSGPTGQYTVLMGCPDNKLFNLSNTPLSNVLPEHLAVDDYIHIYPPAGGSIKVFSTQQVYFKAGNVIEMLPGFSTETGCVFQAKIGPCEDCSGYRQAASPQDETKPSEVWEENALLVKQGESFDLKSESDIAEISIWTVSGTLVQNLKPDGSEFRVYTDLFSSGMYIIRMQDSQGVIHARRLMVIP